ncbi:MAG TPA: ADOP family duplicated permease, partial [Dongiaceae bacterium]|nr:ADOP family duplicated permease [Dongiaceae bacterium]
MLLSDLRYALRGLRARPGFAAAIVVTLALGIGANAAMFSVIDRLLFRPPPMLRQPALTHRIYTTQSYRGKPFTNRTQPYARITDFTAWTTSFTRTAAVTERQMAVGTGTDAAEMQVAAVNASFFDFFDAPPAAGRYFTPAEDAAPVGTPVAVLSYPLWEMRFGKRADAIGQSLQIGATLYTIIGVTPRGFVGIWTVQPPVAYIPVTVYGNELGKALNLRGESWQSTYHWTWAQMIAERKPDVPLDRANADLTAAFVKSYGAQSAADHDATPLEQAKPHAVAASVLLERGPVESNEAKVAMWLSGVAIIVWLIACANVANLLLARALRRRREIAVRLALGVSRARLARQLLTESLVLGLIGGVAGLLAAAWWSALLREEFLPAGSQTAVMTDARTLAFVGIAAIGAGLLTGLLPILQSTRADLTTDLKSGAREGAVHRSKTRAALLVFQGALSVLLLVGAGLFVRSLRNVQSMRLGYDPEGVLAVDLRMRGVTLDSAAAVELRRRLLETARAIPGVQLASVAVTMPFWSMWSTDLHVAGIDSVDKLGEFDLNAVTPDYLAVMGTRILRGRGITAADVPGAPRAIVVTDAMAKVLWPGRDALGQCIKVDADTVPCSYVVGIAENITQRSLTGDDKSFFYWLPQAQYAPKQGNLYLRMASTRPSDRETVRRKLQALMPGASYVTVTPFTDVIGNETRSWRLGATMFTLFGALALVLAAIGLYSVISYSVAQRTHELGVRAALGAQMHDLVGLVVSQGMRLALAGVAAG